MPARYMWAIVIAAAMVLSACGSNAAISAPATATIPSGTVQTFTNLSRNHVDGPITYPQVPPVGGEHNPVWMNCGIYDKPVPNENAVHSLEHGAVWITYQPDLPQASVEQLRGLVRGHSHVLLSPYDGLPAKVVASAWGVQLRADGADDPQLAKFVATYENGPQTPEPGAPCSGAKGVPLVK
jgi:Protein of unknown function (DUF3105)